MFQRVLKLLLLVVASWCVMTFTHEVGHLLFGWASGASLQSVDLLPWHLPYSIFEPNPHPRITLWGGPILGVALPLTLAWIVRQDWMRFIAYFCVLANGAYLAVAGVSGDALLDTTQLLKHGAHPATIATYCLLTIGWGYVGLRRQCVRVLAPAVVDSTESSAKAASALTAREIQ